ncbi:MAG TPA: MBL fold metallo-hydrolase [Patescibacteria group bacterium]
MIFKTYTVGPIREHPYLIIDGGQALVFDPGGGSGQIIDDLRDAKLLYIVNTHSHPDHIAENAILADMTGAQILIHASDARTLNYDYSNFAKKHNYPVIPSTADKMLKDQDQIKVGSLVFKVIHTPGHTPGSSCYYLEKEKLLITGDTLFYHTIGRTDLPGSSGPLIEKSLQKLFELPKDVQVFPGHGKPTTIGEEVEYRLQVS